MSYATRGFVLSLIIVSGCAAQAQRAPLSAPAPAPDPQLAWRDRARQCYEDVGQGRVVSYRGRYYQGRALVGRAACDQYVEEMQEAQSRSAAPPSGFQPLEVLQLETQPRPPRSP